MRRLTTWAAAAVLPALLVSVLAIGCSGDNKTDAGSGGPKPSKKEPSKTLTAVESTGTATLKGKVKYAGARPDVSKQNEDIVNEMKKKEERCVTGATPEEKAWPTWQVAPDGGVKNVFVWLQPPAGKFFKVDEANLPKDPVVLKQPHCAFVPHAFVLFPSYHDPANPKELKPTGQKLIVKNDAPFAHNTKIDGGEDNPGGNNAIPEGKSLEPMVLSPSSREVSFNCDIHKWMNAYARVFDHPYAAVTDEHGNYEIKNAPAGAEVHLVIWHEDAGYPEGRNGQPITLKAGETTKDFEISKK